MSAAEEETEDTAERHNAGNSHLKRLETEEPCAIVAGVHLPGCKVCVPCIFMCSCGNDVAVFLPRSELACSGLFATDRREDYSMADMDESEVDAEASMQEAWLA